jgi:serine protease inhibitor
MLQFRQTATYHEPFWLDDGETVQVALMHQQQPFRYLQARGYQAVELDYEGSDLSMLLLLPEQRDGLRYFEKTISLRMLQQCVSQLRPCAVALCLPRFKFTWGTVNVNKQLEALGMTLPFDRSHADFSGINGHKPPHEEALFVSAVFHQWLVEVNEQGTEAAAATAAVMMDTDCSAASSSGLPRRSSLPVLYPRSYERRDCVSRPCGRSHGSSKASTPVWPHARA